MPPVCKRAQESNTGCMEKGRVDEIDWSITGAIQFKGIVRCNALDLDTDSSHHLPTFYKEIAKNSCSIKCKRWSYIVLKPWSK
ncbi:hypothetical protein TNCV_104791 [Trichonephila clavipes]|nr:hypothetical protein TNCV_104791 [Trichonephila clavipes]